MDVYLSKLFLAGVLNSVLTTYPCYKCLAPSHAMHDFHTPFDLRHTALIEYHVKTMRRLLRTEGVTARNDYRKYPADVVQIVRRRLADVVTGLCFLQGVCTLYRWSSRSSGGSRISTRSKERRLTSCTTWNPEL